MAGQSKHTVVLTRDGEEPELMALLLDDIATTQDELFQLLHEYDVGSRLPAQFSEVPA